MKKILFKKILVLSKKEKVAREISFNNNINIIYGKSIAGKSHVIQSLFATFGCEASTIEDKWFEDTYTALSFQIDNQNYTIIRSGDIYAIFDAQNKIIDITTHISSGIGKFLAEKLGLSVRLTHQRDGSELYPYPSFLFMPFYINQEDSWKPTWNAFPTLRQVAEFRKTMIFYHTGIESEEYFKVKRLIREKSTVKNKLDKELSFKKSTLQKFNTKYKAYDFAIDPDLFKQEITELLSLCSKLKKQENLFKAKLQTKYSELTICTSQIQMLDTSLRAIDKDLAYLSSIQGDSIKCPVCGEIHTNSYVEKLTMGNDLEELQTSRDTLYNTLITLQEETAKLENSLKINHTELSRISELLESKQGDVKLSELLKTETEHAFKEEMEKEIIQDDKIVTILLGEIAKLEQDIKPNPQKRKEIFSFFKQRFDAYRTTIHVTEKGIFEHILDYRIKAGGNQAVRLVLAYFYAILDTIKKFNGSFSAPIVIDEPKQQGATHFFYKQELEFIRDNIGANNQAIIALTDMDKCDFGPQTQIINIDGEESLLIKEQYSQVNATLRPLIKQVNETILKKQEEEFDKVSSAS